MATKCYAIVGDAQTPYHDPRALDVCGQICADAKLDLLVINGDWGDFRTAGSHPQNSKSLRVVGEMKQELAISRERLHTFVKGIKPKKSKMTSGNHEWRLERLLTRDRAIAQLMEIAEIGEAISMPSIFKLKDIGMEWVGQYPRGFWLEPGLPAEENVWVEHGMTARQKGGYTVTGVMEKRWSSAVVGHCEKLALVWTRKNGRDFFGIESGNLSLIAEPGKGDDIYFGTPHSTPEYMDHRQGFTLIYRDGGQWHPQILKIRDGKCHFNGKLYKA
jgi:hypothetical protein